MSIVIHETGKDVKATRKLIQCLKFANDSGTLTNKMVWMFSQHPAHWPTAIMTVRGKYNVISGYDGRTLVTEKFMFRMYLGYMSSGVFHASMEDTSTVYLIIADSDGERETYLDLEAWEVLRKYIVYMLQEEEPEEEEPKEKEPKEKEHE
jgi:hypothetical protein